MGGLALLAVAMAVLALLALVVCSNSRDHERLQAEYAKVVAANGWSWLTQDDSWTARWRGPPFDRGRNRRATNIIQGQWHGRPIVAFEYTCKIEPGNGGVASTRRYSVCAMALPIPPPALQVQREGVVRMSEDVGAGVSWRIEGRDVLMWSERHHLPIEVPHRLSRLKAIVDGIPGFVWRDHGMDHGMDHGTERVGQTLSW